MVQTSSFLKGKHILAVDDEPDILETIQDILNEAKVDPAQDYESASKKIRQNKYDLAVLDIMGVNGLRLLEECVKTNIPAIMLTANSMNSETLVQSIKKGAISYLSKENLSELDLLINQLMEGQSKGIPIWKLLFEKLSPQFNRSFGRGWKDDHKDFLDEFEKTWQISKGIQERIRHDKNIIDKGI